jgi:hypothetical protein
MSNFHPISGQTYILGSSIGSSDTSILLSSFLLPVSGAQITMAMMNSDICYATIAPKTTSSEFISFTGITANANGTSTLTGVTRGLNKSYPFTSNATFKLPHSGQSQFIISDAPQLFEKYAVKSNDEIIDGQWTFTNTPIVPGTVSDASTTVKGVTKLSVAPVSASDPIAVGDNDPRVASTPTAAEKLGLAGSQGVVSATNVYETEDNVFTADTDQTQTTQNSTQAVGEADATTKANYLAQSFIPTKTKIRGVNLYKSANTGTFTGTVTVALQANVAGSPSGVDLATVTITNVNYNNYAIGSFEALFSSEYASLVQGSLYWIVIQTSTSDNSNHPNLGTNTAGGYANGSVKLKNVTDGWVDIANIDLYFKTLQGVNSQVIQSTVSGKIPTNFIDSTYPIQAYQQMLNTDITNANLGSLLSGSGSNQDGSVLYSSTHANNRLVRYQRDTYTGYYTATHQINPTITINDNCSIIQIDTYIYLFTNDGTNIVCSRFLAADLTGEQVMTVPTLTEASYVLAWTDGVYAYVVRTSDTTHSNKWSVSGTTFSAVSTATCSNTLTNKVGACSMFDGTNVYCFTAVNEAQITVQKLTNITGETVSTSTIGVTGINTFGDDLTSVGGVIVNIDKNRIYLGRFAAISNETAQVNGVLVLTPVTKP